MSATPHSGSAAYCTNARFLLYFDERAIADLVSDADDAVDVSSLSTNDILTEMLQAAAGEIEALCLKGNRYQPEDLALLTGNSAALLASLNASRAYLRLHERRPTDRPLPPLVERSEKLLVQLGNGDAIFAFQENQDAGNIGLATVHDSDLQQAGLTTFTAARLLGVRNNRGR